MSRTGSTKKESPTTILRDLLVFQAKLWIEGFKDVVLMPVSLGAAVIDLLFGNSYERGALYAVMRLGDRFERWVDLYAALEVKGVRNTGQASPSASVDDHLNKVVDGFEKRGANGGSERTTPPDSS